MLIECYKKSIGGIVINIQLDFTTIICDLGHVNAYSNKKCEICQEDFSQFAPHIDPKVEKRKELFAIIFDTINEKEVERKTWFKKYRKNEVSKIQLEEPFDTIQMLISRLHEESKKNIFDNVNLISEVISNQETINEIKSFEVFMGSLFDIMFDAEKLELKTILKNINNRLILTIRLFIGGYKDLLNAFVAPNYQNAIDIQNEGQKKIDFAINEINIISNIIDNQNIMFNIDILADGEINQSALIAMIFGNKCETITETINNSNKLTHYYFSSLINEGLEEIDQSKLINLTAYMYMGTSLFDDTDYFRKISIVTKVLEKAMMINPERFKVFFKAYSQKFIYLQEKLSEFSTDVAFVLGNSPPDDMLMRHSIKWYKDLSEGIYKDASRLIYYCMNIINQKEFENDDILIWLGFGDIVGDFEQQRRLKLNHLTEGVEKIIRHSEAHFDYVIKDGIIDLRNLVPREKEVNHKQFTYDEFFDITNKLAETIFAIMCGINLHFINNATDFVDEIKLIEEAQKKPNNMNMTQILFAISGIVIEKQEITYTGKSTLNIEGRLVSKVEINELSNTIFNACAYSFIYEYQIDEINLSLSDIEGYYLGNAIVPTKYLKRYQEDNSNFKDFNMLLVKLSSEIDDVFNNNVTNDRDLICLKSVFVYLLRIIDSVNLAFRDENMKNNDRVKNELKSTKIELEYLKKFIILYKEFVLDDTIYSHMNMLIIHVGATINHMISGGILTPKVGQDFNALKDITYLSQEFVKLAMNEISRTEYLQGYLK